MYKIRKAYQDDFEKVYPLFQYFNNDKLRKDDWAALFKPICRELNIGFYGFVCENINDNEIIGFLGGISSIREFNGNSFKIVGSKNKSYSIINKSNEYIINFE